MFSVRWKVVVQKTGNTEHINYSSLSTHEVWWLLRFCHWTVVNELLRIGNRFTHDLNGGTTHAQTFSTVSVQSAVCDETEQELRSVELFS